MNGRDVLLDRASPHGTSLSGMCNETLQALVDTVARALTAAGYASVRISPIVNSHFAAS